MNYTELKKAMISYNKKYSPRFLLNESTGELLIGECGQPFTFKEDNYQKAYSFIKSHKMLENDINKCFGDELFYKGYKWEHLTQEQKDSIINPEIEYYSSHKDTTSISQPEDYPELFNTNKSFLNFKI